MAPGQHTYLYREAVAKILGNTLIPKKVIQNILNINIKRFYINADPPTRHEKYVEDMEYIQTKKLIFNKGEVAKLIHMWHPDCKYPPSPAGRRK